MSGERTGFSRIEVFERAARALRREVYICPLCMREFNREAVDDRILTWEHIPPRSVDGKRIILTCWECNSRAGHALDSAAHRRAQHHQFIESLVRRDSDYEGILKAQIGGEEITCRVSIRGTEVRIEGIAEQNDPAAIRRMQEALERHVEEGTWEGSEIKLSTIYGFKQRRSQLSDLRTGYLAAFATFGYRYIQNSDLDSVRNQLQHPEEELLPRGFQTYLGWNIENERSVTIVRDPFPMLFVRIDRCAVVLPSFEIAGEPWTRLTETISPASRVTLRGVRLDWPTEPRFLLDLPEEEPETR